MTPLTARGRVDFMKEPCGFGSTVEARAARHFTPHASDAGSHNGVHQSYSANLIIPVPLHPEANASWFQPALLLAKELSRLSGLPLDEHAMVRRSHTKRHRAGMDAKARRQSVAGAFALRHADSVEGRRVLLVDDVFTTGATYRRVQKC